MVVVYFVLVVLYFLFGYLFLPDEICATGLYFFCSLLFPVVVFMFVGALIHTGIIKAPPVAEPSPPEPEEDGAEPPPPSSPPVVPVPSTPREILCSVDSMSGYDFEHWCAGLLLRLSFSGVEVTQASGDQGVDVLAEKGGVRYAIQCKCYSSDIGNHSVQEVHAGKSMYNCHVGVVMTNRHFTPAAKELARITGTLLWDRDALLEMLESLE